MVRLITLCLPFLLVTLCSGTEYGRRNPNSTVPNSLPKRSPSTSRLYFQAYSLTKTGDKVDQHDSDNNKAIANNNNNIPSNVENAISGVKKFPESIQAVNRSLEDATLKLAETRHLLGYEPETWNNRYTPPIPLDVLASENDEHDESTDDDDGGDNDSDESNDDEQTQESNNNRDDDDGEGSEESRDDAPEQDGEVTEEYNDENAQKVIDEIDGDIYGQEGAGKHRDDFNFAATEQKPTILTPNGKASDKQKRCKTIYREINGFTPSSKLLSDDDDFDLHWRRKRNAPEQENGKEGPVGTGQAKSSSYMITRQCTFDDDDDDQSEDDSSENSADNDHDTKPVSGKRPLKNSDDSSHGSGEKSKSALSSIWSSKFPKSVPSTLSSSSPPSPPSSSFSSSSSLPFSPSSLSSSTSSSSRRTPGTRSESRFIPIFGWKKHKHPFIIHEEEVTPAAYYSEEPAHHQHHHHHDGLPMSNDFRPKSNSLRVAMNNDFGSDTEYWLQPGQQWNGWNHFSDSSEDEHNSRPNSVYGKSHSNSNPDGAEDDDGNAWNTGDRQPRYFQNWRPQKDNKYPRKSMQKSSHADMEKSMKNVNERHQQKHRFTHSDDGDDGEGQQEDEHSDDSGEDEGSNDEEDSGMDRAPADSHDDGGSVRRMFTQHIRKRRSADYSGALNNANFAWTQPAKAAKIQLSNDTPYTWNYFEQQHPDSNNHDDNSETFERKPISEDSKDDEEEEQENDDESNDNHSDSDGSGSNDSESDGSESNAEGGHDPENYSISYDGGNDEEYNVDYDSDRATDRGNGFNGGNTVSSADDDDEYEKF